MSVKCKPVYLSTLEIETYTSAPHSQAVREIEYLVANGDIPFPRVKIIDDTVLVYQLDLSATIKWARLRGVHEPRGVQTILRGHWGCLDATWFDHTSTPSTITSRGVATAAGWDHPFLCAMIREDISKGGGDFVSCQLVEYFDIKRDLRRFYLLNPLHVKYLMLRAWSKDSSVTRRALVSYLNGITAPA